MDSTTSDVELLTRARQGDRDAVAELYARHRAAARRMAGSYARAGDPDDLVNEAFARVLGAIERGGGPDGPLRPYLYVTLRRVAMEAIARARDEPVADLPEPVLALAPAPAIDPVDRQIVLDAYTSLSVDQQSVLWQTAVEGRPPRELAPILGLSANAVAAVASRARNRLREAYLQAHVAVAPRPECEPHRSRLGAYVRDGLGRRHRVATDAHVDDCASCRDLVLELQDVNGMLVRTFLPVFVGVSGVAGVGGLMTATGTAGLAAGAGLAATAAVGAGGTGAGASAGVGAGAAAGAGVAGGAGGVGAAVGDVGAGVRGGGRALRAGRRLLSKSWTNPAVVAAGVVGTVSLSVALMGSTEDGERPRPPEVAMADPLPAPRPASAVESPPPVVTTLPPAPTSLPPSPPTSAPTTTWAPPPTTTTPTTPTTPTTIPPVPEVLVAPPPTARPPSAPPPSAPPPPEPDCRLPPSVPHESLPPCGGLPPSNGPPHWWPHWPHHQTREEPQHPSVRQ